jgi:hypothetical protein
MSYTPCEVAEHVGNEPDATFEVARGTDTESVDATPKNVYYGTHTRGPMVMLNYSKYHSFLPPWQNLVSFTLDGRTRAEFGMPEHDSTRITGDLKTVSIISPVVNIHG